MALAALALAEGRTVSNEVLAESLWGDELPANVRRPCTPRWLGYARSLDLSALVATSAGYILCRFRSTQSTSFTFVHYLPGLVPRRMPTPNGHC